MATKLELRAVTKRYGDFAAADKVSLELNAGELVTLLGPSGSGKTTTMMMIAGFVRPDQGDVVLDGNSLVNVPPHRRDIGVVFQNYALFPHMSVRSNVEFPLRERRIPHSECHRRADAMLELVGLSGYQDRRIGQLSGGQQQRVALARALVFNPSLLILDEPLSALDKRLREQMQVEIRRIQEAIGVTVLCVTHDQTEAFVLSDRIAIMNEGRLLQIGQPRDVYAKPVNEFVARFLGESNILQGSVTGDGHFATSDGIALQLPAGGQAASSAALLIRPERIRIAAREERPSDAPAATLLDGIVRTSSFLGDATIYEVKAGVTPLIVRVPNDQAHRFEVGDNVHLVIPRDAGVLLPSNAQ